MDISEGKRAEENQGDTCRETCALLSRTVNEKTAILSALKGLVSIRFIDPDLRVVWDNTDPVADPVADPEGGGPKSGGRYCYQIIRGRTEPCSINCTLRQALTEERIQTRETQLDDGRTFIVGANPVKDETGAVLGVIYVRLDVTNRKKMEEEVYVTHKFLHSFLQNSPTPFAVFNFNGRIDMVNPAWEKLVGMEQARAVGRTCDDIFPKAVSMKLRRANQEVLRSGDSVEFEESIEFPSGTRHFHTVKFPLRDASGRVSDVGAISVDLTDRKHAEQELADREHELMGKSLQLEEANTALRVLLRQREADQRQLEEKIVANIQQLVLPYVERLRGGQLNRNQRAYLDIVASHLNDIVSPFLHHVVSTYPNMTTKEMQVASLVREGKTNKEISGIMGLSVNTVQIHRHNLRRKLGLKNKKVNLRSYLLSLNLASGSRPA